jgi:hypothetical protein
LECIVYNHHPSLFNCCGIGCMDPQKKGIMV